jgi:hypothetical protein
MKIRTGFVSNSSSSSFVAWGVLAEEIKFPDEMYLSLFEKHSNYYLSKDKNDPMYNSWYKSKVDQINSLKTNEEKIEYAKENLDPDYYKNGFEKGGQDSDFVGLTVEYFLKEHPEIRFADVYEYTAQELNKAFGSNFTRKDIGYREEGWYNG